MRPSGTHLYYKRVCPSVRPSVLPSVRPSVRPSITPVQKPRFSAVFGLGEILYWFKRSTNEFWESPLLLSRFICQFVHLSFRSCHMFNTRRDTVWTHRCPVERVLFLCNLANRPLLLKEQTHFPPDTKWNFFFSGINCKEFSRGWDATPSRVRERYAFQIDRYEWFWIF